MKGFVLMSDLINYEVEFIEDCVLLSSCLRLGESDLDVLNSIASVYGCTVGDVILRCVKLRIDAYNFVHSNLKSLIETSAASSPPSGKLDIPDEIGIASGIANN